MKTVTTEIGIRRCLPPITGYRSLITGLFWGKWIAISIPRFQGATIKALFALAVSSRCPVISPHGQSGSERPSRFGRATLLAEP
jgi:hypothetical protein